MITKALLFDLFGPKVLASSSSVKESVSDEFLLHVVDKYSELMSELARKPVTITFNESAVYLARVNESTLVVATSDSQESIAAELEAVDSIGVEMRSIVSQIPVRDAKDKFASIADGKIRKSVHICFVCESNPIPQNHSGYAASRIVEILSTRAGSFTRATRVGPFDVYAMQMTFGQIAGSDWNENLARVDVFAVILYPPFSVDKTISAISQKIRANSSAKMLVVPGSDTELEAARNLESSYYLELCDSVSSVPSNLLLSVLATSGYADMHPELARERWTIDEFIDSEMDIESKRAGSLGHQAFFVIDKHSGDARFTYLYDKDAVYMATATNVVAAISQLQLDASPTSTSVFSAGGLNYAIIERNDIVFTLITGDKEDVEVMRERFSFLPDLYLDEAPENKESSGELFESPPFTLKLLATLPPEDLPGRIAPQKVQAPDWERFESDLVKDFLLAVWNSLDGHKTISELTNSTGGPDMVMGAIHLLKRMDAIKWRVRIFPEDVPSIVSQIPDEVRSLYSHVDSIVDLVDGHRSISEIGAQLGFESSVLIAVFGELHRRGNIALKE